MRCALGLVGAYPQKPILRTTLGRVFGALALCTITVCLARRLSKAKTAETGRMPLRQVKALIDAEPALAVNVSTEVQLCTFSIGLCVWC